MRKLNHNIKTAFGVLLVISLIIIACTPYFILGEKSAIGWHDEMDLPISSMLSKLALGMGFHREIAGGSYLEQNFSPINQYLNIYELLNLNFNSYVAAALFRIINYVGLVVFGFVYLRSSKDQPEQMIWLMVGSLIVAFASVYSYAWTLGGYGLLFCALYFAGYIVATSSLSMASVLMTIISALFISKSYGGVSVSLAMLPFVSLLIWIAKGKGKLSNFIALLVVNMIFIAIFNYQELRQLQILASSDSARVTGYLSIELKESTLNIGQILISIFNDIKIHYASDRHAYVLLILIPLSFVFGSKADNLKILKIFSVIFFSHIIIQIFLPNKFRPDQLLIFSFPLLALEAIGIALIAANLNQNILIRYLIATVLFLVAIIVAFQMAFRMKNSIDYAMQGANWAAYSEKFSNVLDDRYRAYVDSAYIPRPEFLQVSGVRTIDGMRPTFSKYRTLYWFEVLPLNSIRDFHTHRQTSYNFKDNNTAARDEGLELANVKYVISSRSAVTGVGFNWQEKEACIENRIMCEFYLRLFGCSLEDLSRVKALNVRELTNPWDYVYIPNAVKVSEFKELSHGYVNELRKIKRHEVLLPFDYQSNDFKLNHSYLKPDYKLTGSILTISGLIGVNILAINEEYNNNFEFQCKRKGGIVSVVRANLIHTAVLLDGNCDLLEVNFK